MVSKGDIISETSILLNSINAARKWALMGGMRGIQDIKMATIVYGHFPWTRYKNPLLLYFELFRNDTTEAKGKRSKDPEKFAFKEG